MKGVSFDSLHSFREWGLILSSKEIGSPAIKESKIDIEGADGELDYTEYFGGVKFGNRTLKFEFRKAGISAREFLILLSDVHDALYGRKMTVALDDDSDWYYQGRCKVADFSHNGRIAKISVEVDAEPYKLKKTATKRTEAVLGTVGIMLTNSRKPVVPTITTDAAMQFAFKGNSYNAAAGTFRIPALQLEEGQNAVTVTGSGTVTFEYREGRL